MLQTIVPSTRRKHELFTLFQDLQVSHLLLLSHFDAEAEVARVEIPAAALFRLERPVARAKS